MICASEAFFHFFVSHPGNASGTYDRTCVKFFMCALCLENNIPCQAPFRLRVYMLAFRPVSKLCPAEGNLPPMSPARLCTSTFPYMYSNFESVCPICEKQKRSIKVFTTCWSPSLFSQSLGHFSSTANIYAWALVLCDGTWIPHKPSYCKWPHRFQWVDWLVRMTRGRLLVWLTGVWEHFLRSGLLIVDGKKCLACSFQAEDQLIDKLAARGNWT